MILLSISYVWEAGLLFFRWKQLATGMLAALGFNHLKTL